MYVQALGWALARKDKIDLESSTLMEKQGLYTCPAVHAGQKPFHCCLQIKQEPINVRLITVHHNPRSVHMPTHAFPRAHTLETARPMPLTFWSLCCVFRACLVGSLLAVSDDVCVDSVALLCKRHAACTGLTGRSRKCKLRVLLLNHFCAHLQSWLRSNVEGCGS